MFEIIVHNRNTGTSKKVHGINAHESCMLRMLCFVQFRTIIEGMNAQYSVQRAGITEGGCHCRERDLGMK